MIFVVQVIETKEKTVRNFYRCTCSYAISVIVFSCNICLALKMYLERSPVINKNAGLWDGENNCESVKVEAKTTVLSHAARVAHLEHLKAPGHGPWRMCRISWGWRLKTQIRPRAHLPKGSGGRSKSLCDALDVETNTASMCSNRLKSNHVCCKPGFIRIGTTPQKDTHDTSLRI